MVLMTLARTSILHYILWEIQLLESNLASKFRRDAEKEISLKNESRRIKSTATRRRRDGCWLPRG